MAGDAPEGPAEFLLRPFIIETADLGPLYPAPGFGGRFTDEALREFVFSGQPLAVPLAAPGLYLAAALALLIIRRLCK
jgi:hypothetical protein